MKSFTVFIASALLFSCTSNIEKPVEDKSVDIKSQERKISNPGYHIEIGSDTLLYTYNDSVIYKGLEPNTIRVDNGPKFIIRTFRRYCLDNNIKIDYIEPGKPVQNAFNERFNGSYRKELLDLWVFKNLLEVEEHTEISLEESIMKLDHMKH